MKLHNVQRKGNRYCGPAALSILTGCDTGQAAALLRKASGRRAIKGTYHSEMLDALRLLGITPYRIAHQGQLPTLAQWHRETRRSADEVILLSVGYHFAVVQGRRYVCGLTTTPVPLRKAPKWRARVRAAWKLQKVTDVKLESLLPPPAPRPDYSLGKKAKALAAEHGITIDDTDWRSLGHLWIDCPPWFNEDTDPFYGEHIVTSWAEALERVNEYISLKPVEPCSPSSPIKTT